MRFDRGRLLSLSAIFAVGCAVAAGCGGDDADGNDGDRGGEAPTGETAAGARSVAAKGTPEDLVEELSTELATTTRKRDCDPIEAINSRSVFRFDCPPAKGLRKSMADFEVVDAASYGTGAVVDYKSGKAPDGAAMVLYVSPNRKWGITRFGLLTEPSVGTSDEDSRAGFAKTVNRYMKAVGERNCQGYTATALTTVKSDAVVCKRQFPTTDWLTKLMKQNPNAKPEYLGGNDTFGFFGYTIKKPAPNYVTISVVKTGAGTEQPYAVMDLEAGPSPNSTQPQAAAAG